MMYVTRRQRAEKRKKKFRLVAVAIIAVAILCVALFGFLKWRSSEEHRRYQASLKIPEYSGQVYAEINGNIPFFDDEDKTTRSFESYSELDSLGRCGVAYANVSKELMSTEDRGEIRSIKPSGWQQAKYEGESHRICTIAAI